MRAALATLAVACCGAAALWWGTEGGQALTSEAARRLDIARAPRALPDVVLHDQNGALTHLSDYRAAPVVLEFVYTTCPDICLALGTAFERLDAALPRDARLISISFDPADDTARLGDFADRYDATAPRWRVAGIKGDAARAALLDRAGVVVIPDGFGGFVHNAGLYLVDAQGRLTAVFDPEDTRGLRAALADDAR
ncbi:SCO family protein [Phaeovulum sp. NW3]|uniref:SCO family protein n=1 Tax=Phaeovulum sp. NW3 TaxID=2934933 RepID=UPI0020215469|nr:SCO family protein [Phaeovulum sp. NW3]MCL7466565.1 SCO family protein [Phaeovulum sp. NW3]